MMARLAHAGMLVAAAASVMVAGCAQKPLPALTTSSASANAAQYRLGSGDKLRIDTFNEPTLSGEFEISAAGSVDIPLIGAVPAKGMTPAELANAIEAGLRNGYLQQPRVAVQILNYRPFYILGEVAKPGTYPYSVGLTALSAVATAEGFTYRANTKRIFVRHMGDDAESEVALTAATPVMPGDTIRIGERYF